jgi:superfamily II DNA or RNA helicase
MAIPVDDGEPCRRHQLELCAICIDDINDATAPIPRARFRSTSKERRAPWQLVDHLRPWQVEALERWVAAGNRGIVEAATGTGKTMLAIGAIHLLRGTLEDALRIAIVVPTTALADQWRVELQRKLGLRSDVIGDLHSAATVTFEHIRHPILITVLPTARRRLPAVITGWMESNRKTLLIVDECHRAGSDFNRSIFDATPHFTLGLSATPERDDGNEVANLYPAIGEPVFRYPLVSALDDDILAPLVSVNLYVDFTTHEQMEWNAISEDLTQAFAGLFVEHPHLRDLPSGKMFKHIALLAKNGHPQAGQILRLLTDRRRVLDEASQRAACVNELLHWVASIGRKAIIFHETITSAQYNYGRLRRAGVRVAMDHSQLPKGVRRGELEGFRTRRYRVLVAVRALDEGIDVPAAEVAVIAAGTRSRRQRIQRIGRVLRPETGKTAVVVSVLVRGTPEEPFVGGRDQALLGDRRVRHHRWPMQALANVLPDEMGNCVPDTYQIAAPEETVEEPIDNAIRDLTLRELGVQPQRF